jgi:cell shape-determining protein MreC
MAEGRHLQQELERIEHEQNRIEAYKRELPRMQQDLGKDPEFWLSQPPSDPSAAAVAQEVHLMLCVAPFDAVATCRE